MSHSHVITFDTHALVKKLEASGIEAKQSEAITEAIADVFDVNFDHFATKNDIHLLDIKIDKMGIDFEGKLSKMGVEFDGKLSKMGSEFDSKLSRFKSDLITWVVGLVFAQTAILSIIKFMH